MKTFSVNSNRDMFTQNGFIVLAEGVTAVGQRCTQVMQTVRGEMVYAIDRGIPFYDTVWTGSPNLLAFEAAARDALLSIPNVRSVDSFSVNVSSNTLNYEARVNTTYGAVTINGSL